MKILKILLIVVLAALIAGAVIFFFCDDVMADVYFELGSRAEGRGDEAAALTWYERAFSKDTSDFAFCQTLALRFAEAGNYTKAERTLYDGINATPEQAGLYLTLSSVYTMQDKLLDAATLLDSVRDPTAKAEVEAARPAAPEISEKSGTYNEFLTVTVDFDADTVCFIDLTGDYPSVNGTAYGGGIALPEGETILTAVSVNGSGIVSPMVRRTYHIDHVVRPVAFSDPVIEAVVRRELDRSGDLAVISSELWAMESLTVTAEDGLVADWGDLVWFPGLRSLTLEDQEDLDLEGIAAISSLKELSLRSCGITSQDLEPLAQLTGLETLDLTGNSVATLNHLTPLQNLRVLRLAENSLSDLTPLENMPNLEELDLRENAVSDIEVLSQLGNLRRLDLEDDLVTDLTPLTNAKLEYLNISRCTVGSIKALGTILPLEELHADSCEIYDIGPLATCANLRWLSARDNQIYSLSALSLLTDLEYADLTNNVIGDAADLSGMRSLTELHLAYNQITGGAPFASLPALELLNLDYNRLTGIADLIGCRSLRTLYCFGNDITDRDVFAEARPEVTVYG